MLGAAIGSLLTAGTSIHTGHKTRGAQKEAKADTAKAQAQEDLLNNVALKAQQTSLNSAVSTADDKTKKLKKTASSAKGAGGTSLGGTQNTLGG